MDLREDDNTGRSILIGIGCTLLFHVLLVVLAPEFSFQRFAGVHSGISVTHANTGKSFDFELAQPVEEPKQPFNFIEANTAAPENVPDKTNNFSSRNQQAAQDKAATEKDPDGRPSVTGQDKIKNDTSIVSGDMAKPQPAVAPTPDLEKKDSIDQQEQKARAALVPLSGFEKSEGKAEDGIATNVANSKLATNHADQSVEGAADATATEGALLAVPGLSKAQPKQRPRLASTSLNRNSILTNRAAGTANIGIQAADAFKSEYGEYLQELIEIVQTSWWNILAESHVSPPHGSHVAITFKLNSQGMTEIVKVEDADAGKQGVWFCQHAIQDRQPYRKWTEQMITLLGDEQQLGFVFYYQ